MSEDAGKTKQASEPTLACSFCGGSFISGVLVFAAPKATICENCVVTIYDKIALHYQKKSRH